MPFLIMHPPPHPQDAVMLAVMAPEAWGSDRGSSALSGLLRLPDLDSLPTNLSKTGTSEMTFVKYDIWKTPPGTDMPADV